MQSVTTSGTTTVARWEDVIEAVDGPMMDLRPRHGEEYTPEWTEEVDIGSDHDLVMITFRLRFRRTNKAKSR